MKNLLTAIVLICCTQLTWGQYSKGTYACKDNKGRINTLIIKDITSDGVTFELRNYSNDYPVIKRTAKYPNSSGGTAYTVFYIGEKDETGTEPAIDMFACPNGQIAIYPTRRVWSFYNFYIEGMYTKKAAN